MSNFLDTVMNIEVFLFIGLLIWLYFKPVNKDTDSSDYSRVPASVFSFIGDFLFSFRHVGLQFFLDGGIDRRFLVFPQ